MSRRLRILLKKELRQHALALLGLGVFVGGTCVVQLLATLSEERLLTVMTGHLEFSRLFVPIVAAIMGRRLVVRELYGRTQRFLEGLPVRRAEWMALKGGLGLIVVVASAFFSLTSCALVAASNNEVISLDTLLIIAAKTAVWSADVWFFFFLMGTSGRMRYVAYCFTFVCAFFIQEYTELDLLRVPPLSLVDERMVLEHDLYPVGDLVAGSVLAVSMLLLAMALSLINDGSLTESLSRRMSQKEMALLSLVTVSTFMMIFVLDERQKKEPYRLTRPSVVRSNGVSLAIDPGTLQGRKSRRARELLVMIEADIRELSTWLGWRGLPPVLITHRSDLDGEFIESVGLSKNDGVLLRANFDAADFDTHSLRFAVIRRLADAHTEGRSGFEPKAWITDGLLSWWVEQRATPERASRSLLRGLWATRRHPVDNSMLKRWLRTCERFGPETARGVAHSGMVALEKLADREKVNALAQAVLSRWAPKDGRSLMYEWRNPMQELFESATQIPLNRFLVLWNAHLEQMRLDPAYAFLSELPDVRASVDIEPGRGDIRHIRWRVVVDRPVPPGATATLAHRLLGVFDTGLIPVQSLRREDHLWQEGKRVFRSVLPGAYGPGDRALLTVELGGLALGTSLRVHAERRLFE